MGLYMDELRPNDWPSNLLVAAPRLPRQTVLLAVMMGVSDVLPAYLSVSPDHALEFTYFEEVPCLLWPCPKWTAWPGSDAGQRKGTIDAAKCLANCSEQWCQLQA